MYDGISAAALYPFEAAAVDCASSCDAAVVTAAGALYTLAERVPNTDWALTFVFQSLAAVAESGILRIFVLAVFWLLCPRLVVAVGLLIVAVLVVSIRVMVSMEVELP